MIFPYSTPIDVCKNNENTGIVSISIPSISNTLTFKCLKTSKTQKQFIIHGFEIVNIENKGVIYHSSGVGGAKFNSLLNIENLNKQLKIIAPDLIILDFGTNDFLYSDSIKESLKIDIKNVIASIRKSSPLASIVLCTVQDIFYKQKNLNATIEYMNLIKKIAKETETAYWDWFSVSGGKGALKVWLNQGLAKTDLIHLSNNGYRIKGKLLFEAIENTKIKFESSTNQNEFILVQQPKKIEPNVAIKNENNITTLSNRDIVQADKQTIDSIINKNNYQNEIIRNDSINNSKKPINSNITLPIKNDNTSNKNISSKNQNLNETITNKNNNNSQNSINSKLASDTIKSKPIDYKTNVNSTNIEITKTKTNEPIANTAPKEQLKEIKKTEIKNTINQKTEVKIKVEQIEDFNDSTVTTV